MVLVAEIEPEAGFELGERFGGKDHTTVMSAVRKIESRLESEDRELLDCVEAIQLKLEKKA